MHNDKDINNMSQNHPELVVKDLSGFVDSKIIRRVLKFRGINKWLRVRRLLIQLKTVWLLKMKSLEVEAAEAKREDNFKKYHRLRGEIKGVASSRQQVRCLCQSPRDVDFPTNYRDFGSVCVLPDLPELPSKRIFLKYDKKKGKG